MFECFGEKVELNCVAKKVIAWARRRPLLWPVTTVSFQLLLETAEIAVTAVPPVQPFTRPCFQGPKGWQACMYGVAQ